MVDLILENCGVFALPQLFLSVITVGLFAAYMVALRRRELEPREAPWEKTLEPLAGISTAIGLLGSIVGFITAFGGFRNGLDVQQLTRGLAGAYWTTGVGIATALVASCGAYLLTVLNTQGKKNGT